MFLFAFLIFFVLSFFLPCLPSEHVLSARGHAGGSLQGWALFFVKESLGQAVERLSLRLSVLSAPTELEWGLGSCLPQITIPLPQICIFLTF